MSVERVMRKDGAVVWRGRLARALALLPDRGRDGERHRGHGRVAQQPGRGVAALVLTARADDARVPASVSVPM